MNLEELTSISPIDGRYRKKTAPFAPFLSEFGLIRYRAWVEIEYFIALEAEGLLNLKGAREDWQQAIRNIYLNFSLDDAKRIKEIEAITNHDVKAVEYLLKEKFETLDPVLAAKKEFLHFGLTSQDINNTATPMSLRDALQQVLLPAFGQVSDRLNTLATEWEDIPMLARTHGQPASPTSLGKEFRVFVARLENQVNSLKALPFPAKFGGATGNFNAHVVAYPDRDWHAFGKKFVEENLGLSRSFPTTQIEHYDGLAAIFDNLKRINVLLTDLCIDTWIYISQEYFGQKTLANEVGSSAMPHKVNPIDFENAEGNFGLANALYEFLSRKLPVSRLQRDLTDSTVLRNVGTALSHSLIGLQSLLKGLSKLEVNQEKIAADLDKNWAVIAEAIQTVLRREGYPNPYEQLKALTRGKKAVDAGLMKGFIESLEVPEKIKAELRLITPANYIGQ